jgi:hypothetical protein
MADGVPQSGGASFLARLSPAMINFALLAVLTAIMVGLAAVWLPSAGPLWRNIWAYTAVGGIAGLVGYGELVSRYRDSPGRLLGSTAALVYVLLNIAAGIIALDFIRTFGVLETAKYDPVAHVWLYQILLASFGAIAFFRTSLFTVRVGGVDVGIGPSAMLQSLLTVADRMINRHQAKLRATKVQELVLNVDYQKARAPLPTFCMLLLPNPLSRDEQEDMTRQIAAIDKSQVADDGKMTLLGAYLLSNVGGEVLGRAIMTLKGVIAKAPASSSDPLATLMLGLDYAKAKDVLTEAVIADHNPTLVVVDEAAIRRQAAAIDGRGDISPAAKAILLGALLSRLVGADRFSAIVGSLGPDFKAL